MNLFDLARLSIVVVGALLFFFLASRVSKSKKTSRIARTSLACLLFDWGCLFIFMGLPDKYVVSSFFMWVWNLLVWPNFILTLILAQLTILPLRASTTKQDRREAWMTLLLAFAFIFVTGSTAFVRFGEVKGGRIVFRFDMPEERRAREGEPHRFKSLFYSEKFYYGVNFKETDWSQKSAFEQGIPFAEFMLTHEEGGNFIVVPVFFPDKAQPRADVFMQAISKAFEVDINSPDIGGWQQHSQNGFEGYVFDFEKTAQRGEFLYRVKLLSDQDYGYMVAAGMPKANSKHEMILEDIHKRFQIKNVRTPFPDLQQFSDKEKLRHQFFYSNAAKEHLRLGEKKQALKYQSLADQFNVEDLALIGEFLSLLIEANNAGAAKQVLENNTNQFDDQEKVSKILEKAKDTPNIETFRKMLRGAVEELKEDITASPLPSKTMADRPSPRREGVKEDEPLPESEQFQLPIEKIKLPPGFRISVYTNRVSNARQMARGAQGTLFVGSRKLGKVYAVRDTNRDGKGNEVTVIAQGLQTPSGIAFHQGDLYVAEISRILRYKNIESDLKNPPEPEILRDDLPKDLHHGWKYLGVGPDEMLYFPIGAPCNVCQKEDERYATLMKMTLEGEKLEVFSKGVRNSVGFDWHPETKVLWFTDNGRDHLGDDLPADELNEAPFSGLHFGFPYCHAGDILDPEFEKQKSCSSYRAPAQKLGPHVAALGMTFYRGQMFPEEYHGQVFIAEHGSWNRSEKIGYRISLVRLEESQAVSYETFAEGWLSDGKVWGRPADVLNAGDGSLFVSDDYAGAIYRIFYSEA